jgi:hypothetical protein
MGVSLLGLANRDRGHGQEDGADAHAIQVEWDDHNFLGVDLSRLGIRYADGVSKRWRLDNLKFVADSAESCLAQVRDSYPGRTVVSTNSPFLILFSNSVHL